MGLHVHQFSSFTVAPESLKNDPDAQNAAAYAAGDSADEENPEERIGSVINVTSFVCIAIVLEAASGIAVGVIGAGFSVLGGVGES